jgi:aspartate carbamoyltransferase regulatory subunit
MKNQKQLRAFKVFAIKEGTVIDHIPAGQALKIIEVLKLQSNKKIVTTGLNFPSKTLRKKDIIKVENYELNQDQANRVAILAPTATINIINDFVLTKKFKVEIPNKVEKIIICPNPKCITKQEQSDSCFYVEHIEKQIKLQCKYCEKIFAQADINEYNI